MNLQNVAIAVLETTDSVIYLADLETHKLVYVNPAAEKAFHIQRKDWENKKYYHVLLGLDIHPDEEENQNLQEGICAVWQRYNKLTGKYFKVHATIREFEGRKMRFVIAHDITHSINYSNNLETRLNQTDILNSCLQTLIKPIDMISAINSLLAMVGKYYNADRVHIVHVKNDVDTPKEIFEWAQKEDPAASQVLESLSGEAITSWFEQQSVHDVISFSTTETLNQSSELFAENGVYSFIAVPLRNEENKIIGFIGIVNPKANFHNNQLMHSIANFYENYYLKTLYTQNLYKLSHVDSMTEIYNRNSFEEHLNTLRKQKYQNLGIVYMDINDLKTTNDNKGHQAGDALIRHSAQILKDIFQNNIYRIGGDEFAVFMEDISKEDFEEKIKSLKAILAKDINANLSLGYLWDNGTVSIEEHIHNAEAMMYENKKRYYASKHNRRDKY